MTTDFDRTQPQGAVNYFRHCIVTGDLSGAMSCFHKEATYIDRGGMEVKGLDQIDASMKHLCTWKPEIKGSKHRVTIVGDLAIWVDKWTLKAVLPDGNPIEMAGATTCMMKKSEAGIWLWLVDDPFAAEIYAS
ncbi:nuclear transport factor 2 family protein [Taibaiella sp. KBW10]|uniref:YybH family protein n=1 Tax=Taibaiella sp. KBW10 TaxID=2153357 RepID=UPI001F2A2D40|nr:nuclear transport factor 2 family protein [Taibaiella sp. KBW10]